MLDEFCRVTRYHRKYAVRILNGPPPEKRPRKRRPRRPTYGTKVVSVLAAFWEAAGYPWSVRLKALIPEWLPWARKHFSIGAKVESELLKISARQIDRRLREHKKKAGRRLYGRTKPGRLLKHNVPIKTDGWDVKKAGYTEIDLVSHSGNCATGEFAYTLNQVDIHTTWTESLAVLGKRRWGSSRGWTGSARSFPSSFWGSTRTTGPSSSTIT
jgi:hypothetical protein